MIGQTLGSYRILSIVGEGGMGTVYLAQHTLIGRRAAIKVLLPELSRRQDIVSRFFNEARATSIIKHFGIVDIFDFGVQPNGPAYIVMEFLEGESLRARVAREGRPSLELLLTVVRQIAGALGAAHAVGIVHRDLKPDNVFLIPDPDVVGGVRVKILDFGIAKLVGDASARGSFKTSTGSLLGTPVYMSPEQCRGGSVPVDHRADVYALGCILYEMVCGRPPFMGDGMGDLIIAHMQQAPAPPRSLNPSVPPALEALILHLLAKDPRERPQSMDEVVRELGSPLAGAAPLATPIPPPLQVPPQSTTLGSAASQIVLPRGGGLGLWPIVGVLGLAFALALSYPLLRRGPPAASPPQPVADAPPPPPPTATAAVVAEPPDAARPEAARPADVRLTIRSQPDGAEVWSEAGERLGTTPLERSAPRGSGRLTFVLKLAGHLDGRATVASDADGEVTTLLEPAPATASPPPPARPRPRPRSRDGKPVLDDRTVDPFRR